MTTAEKESRFIEVNGFNIHYRLAGRSFPVAINSGIATFSIAVKSESKW